MILFSRSGFAACTVTGDITLPVGVTSLPSGTYTSTYIVPNSGTLDLSGSILDFAEGRKIIVQAGGSLILANTILRSDYSCNKMWSGIEIQTDGSISSNYSIVEDAEYGVYINDNSYIDIETTSFNRNYIGIYVRPNSGVNSFSFFNLTDNEFTSIGTLLPPYSISPSLVGSKTFVGLYLNDCNLSIDGGSNLNNFAGLNIGIFSNNSNLQVQNTIFDNIQPDKIYKNLFDGSAIYALGNGGVYSIRQYGLGKTGPLNFNSCKYGINAEKVNVNCSENNMYDMLIGVRIVKSNHFDFQVRSNTIDATGYGVDLEFNDVSSYYISNNDININMSSGTNGVGIYITEGGAGSVGWWVKNVSENLIYTGQAKYGMYLGNCINVTCIHNVLDLTSNVIKHGIAVIGGKGNVFRCHVVNCDTWLGVDEYQACYYFSSSVDNNLICNKAYNGSVGFRFDGHCGSFTDFNSSEMWYNGYRGLILGPTGIIGDQTNNGNAWFPYSGTSAECQGSPSSSYFFVNPFGSPYIPDIILAPGQWFFGTSGFPAIGCNNSQCTPYLTETMETRLSSQDYFLAIQQSLDPFLAAQQLISKQYLLDKISVVDSQITDANILQFYQQNQNSTINSLVNIQSEFKNGLDLNTVLKSELSQSDSLIDSLLIQLRQNLLMIRSSTDPIYRNNLMNANMTIQNDIRLIQQSHQIDLNVEYASSSVFLNQKLSENNSLSFSETMYENDKVVNDLFLRFMKPDLGIPFSDLDLIQVEELSNLCSALGGEAVFKARPIYQYYFPFTYFDDSYLCAINNYTYRNSNHQNTINALYPNPAGNEIQLAMSLLDIEAIHIDVYNDNSQLVLSTDMNVLPDNNIKVNISDLKTGMYQMVVSSGSKIITSSRFMKL